jgi:two-component system CheB/CheR fusion protein
VIVNDKGEALYVHGHTGKYLELPSGETSLNILDMAREGLRLELTNAMHKAVTQKQEIRYEGLQIKTNGNPVTTNLTVKPVLEPPVMRGLLMVIFEDIPTRTPMEEVISQEPEIGQGQRILRLERELQAKEEFLQTTVEELETSNEELKSTNEELQSSNEELRSTNEELETSKEELQSVNEELVTVNVELQKKIEQLSQANNDMNNLLASTDIGTVFLDHYLRIQRFTPAVTQIIPLIQTDLGRPISDITTNLAYDRLSRDVEGVLKSLVFKEIEVSTREGRWYWMRIAPYRTLENVIEGVVITFVNISKQKQAQLELSKLTHVLEQSASVVMITDVSGKIEYVNPRFTEVTGYATKEAVGKNPRFLQSGVHTPEFYTQLWNTILSGKTWRGEFHNRKKDSTLYWESATISPVKDDDGKITHFIAIKEDITGRKQNEMEFGV